MSSAKIVILSPGEIRDRFEWQAEHPDIGTALERSLLATAMRLVQEVERTEKERVRQEARLRQLYIGSVFLLTRVHRQMSRESRQEFDADGDPMQRLAADFNALGFGVSLERATGGWALFEVKPSPR